MVNALYSFVRVLFGTCYGFLYGSWLVARYRRLRAKGVVTIGRCTYGTPDVHVFAGCDTRLHIGAFTSIADGVTILLGGNHPTHWVSTFPFRARLHLSGAYRDGMPDSKGNVAIGSDVWIGHGAVLLSGVHIGDGAIIGAGALVATSIPPYAIALGVPARVKEFRFNPETIAHLQSIQWWNWPLDRIKDAADLLSSEKVSEFLDFAEDVSSAALQQ